MAAEQITKRSLNGKLMAEITDQEVIIRDRKTLEKRVSAGYLTLRGGGVLLDIVGSATGNVSGIKPPDEEGNPDDGMAALVYTAATMDHPHRDDRRPVDVKVSVANGTSPKVLANLGALGVERPAEKPVLVDGTDHVHWADGYPHVGAGHVVHTFGEYFEPVSVQTPLPVPVPPSV